MARRRRQGRHRPDLELPVNLAYPSQFLDLAQIDYDLRPFDPVLEQVEAVQSSNAISRNKRRAPGLIIAKLRSS